MSEWINNKKPLYKYAVKPCKEIGVCPYGQLVEEYPISEKPTKMSCSVFGHDCPMFYQAEAFAEEDPVTQEEVDIWTAELEKVWMSEAGS